MTVAPTQVDSERSRARSVLAALGFAALVSFVPWESLRGTPYPDVENYVSRILEIGRSGLRAPGGVLGAITGEQLWALLLAAFAFSGVEPRVALSTISFVAAFVFCFWLARRAGAAISFVLLLNPIVVDLLASQVRSALAMSIFLVLVGLRSKRVAEPALLILPAVHTATAVVVAAFAFARARASLDWLRVRTPSGALLLASAFAAVIAASTVPSLLDALGDRRADAVVPVKSSAYLSAWVLLIVGMWAATRRTAANSWEAGLVFSILPAAIVMEALGQPAFRFVALLYPITLVLVSEARPTDRRLLLASFAVYHVALWLLWLP